MPDRCSVDGEPGSASFSADAIAPDREAGASVAPGPDARFSWTRTMEGETVRISLVGELDTATAPRFHEEAPAALDGAGAVIVDCAALTFVDSKGIAALLQLKLCADQHQIELQVQNVSAMARRVLDILGLLDILEVQMPSESQDSEPDETTPS